MDTLNSFSVHTSNKKKIFISILIIIVFCVVGYFVFKKTKELASSRPLTEEEKVKLIEGLRSTPPPDGSVPLTQEEKVKMLNVLSNTPTPKNKNTKPSTPTERETIINSLP